MTRVTIFSITGTILNGANLDCLAQLSGNFSNDAVLETTIFNDSSGTYTIKVSTESTIDTNAFPLEQNENIKLEMNPDNLYLINDSGNTVTYRVLFKLRVVSD